MEVKLTKTGLDLFGFGLDRIIINVNLDRAYRLMTGGYANKDKPFMALYEANRPKPEPERPVIIQDSEKEDVVKKPKPKKEKAISRKAAAREKAVKK